MFTSASTTPNSLALPTDVYPQIYYSHFAG